MDYVSRTPSIDYRAKWPSRCPVRFLFCNRYCAASRGHVSKLTHYAAPPRIESRLVLDLISPDRECPNSAFVRIPLHKVQSRFREDPKVLRSTRYGLPQMWCAGGADHFGPGGSVQRCWLVRKRLRQEVRRSGKQQWQV